MSSISHLAKLKLSIINLLSFVMREGFLQTKFKKLLLVQTIFPMKINPPKCYLDLVPSLDGN
jgi:hypothetical protein